MYIRRKVFSLLTDEEGQERYFSTTEFVYDHAEQREFGERAERRRAARDLAEELEDEGVDPSEAEYVRAVAKMNDKKKNKFERINSADKEVRDAQWKKNKKAVYAASGLAGAGYGAGIGGAASESALGTAIGAGIGAALGIGAGVAGDKYVKRQSARAEKNPEGKASKSMERSRDAVALSKGEMSAKEYASKWKDYDKKNAKYIIR